jgi:hypothetical protein
MKWMAIALLATIPASAQTLRFFGSAGAEAQLTPANARSPLNRGNVARIPYRTNVADATLFGDAKSDAWKLHVKLRGDASDQSADRITLGEAWVRVTAASWLDVTAGRVIEKWGTGYAWNPTAFVSPRKNPADPNDHLAAYRGLDMIRADALVRGTSISLYALDGGDYAARVYRLIGGTDVSLHLTNHQQGLSLARVFGDSLELHGELARRRAVVGGQYTFRNNINVVAEVYRDGGGMSSDEWRAFRLGAARDLLTANRTYRPLQMGRSYGFTRVAWSSGNQKLDAELIAITSLRDGSLLVRATLTRKLRANLSAYLIDTELAGRASAELAYMQVRRATTLGVRWYF